MLKKLNKSKQGFTIIEVLIVLAIAGLILLIVFLAVPALQRNSRNQGRRSDGGRVSSAVNNFVTNNNGRFPGFTNAGVALSAALTTADLDSVITDAGTLGQYPNGIASISGAVPTANAQIAVTTGTAAGTVTYNFDSFLLVRTAVCGAGTTVGTLATSTGASARSGVLLYPQESGGGGNYTIACLSIQ